MQAFKWVPKPEDMYGPMGVPPHQQKEDYMTKYKVKIPTKERVAEVAKD